MREIRIQEYKGRPIKIKRNRAARVQRFDFVYVLLLHGGLGLTNEGAVDGGGARISQDGAAVVWVALNRN